MTSACLVEIALESPWSAEFPVRASRRDEAVDVDGLVKAARSGDEPAFDALYRRFHRMVHGIALAHAPASQVEDAVQETFLAAWQRLPSLRTEAAFPGWLAVIARNAAIDRLRRTPRLQALPDDVPAEDESGKRDALAVMGALGRLPAVYRETLALRLVEGLTGPEIAKQTGLTEGSVRVNLHRGMKKLRALLGDVET